VELVLLVDDAFVPLVLPLLLLFPPDVDRLIRKTMPSAPFFAAEIVLVTGTPDDVNIGDGIDVNAGDGGVCANGFLDRADMDDEEVGTAGGVDS
jgi:hypothetical protein